jgi:molybdopterin/thiamine biosynthesis adenylyltransferase/rhodanese-related sulfurtransferase
MEGENFERYERQLVLKGFGPDAQHKLVEAKVLVIGAGGLGCPALQYLAAAGVRTIGIVDHDTISLNNLHRQILYRTDEIGKLKSEVAATKLKALNPEIIIQSYPFKVLKNNILELLAKYDTILDCTDNFASRYLINDACVLLKKPLIFAAVSGYEGQIAVFNVPDQDGLSTNYRDLFPIPPAAGEIPNCAESGVLGVLPGIIGTMQAAEAIKLIAGLRGALINKLLNYNLLNQDFYQVTIPIPEGNTYARPTKDDFIQSQEILEEIEGSKLDALIKNHDALVLDVREYDELPKLKGSHYHQIPMSVLNEDFLSSIVNRHIILVCQHGIRSLHAAETYQDLLGVEKRFYSLKGGVVRWKSELSDLGLLSS